MKKKHNAIADHQVGEAVVAGVVKVQHINGKESIADILTKATNGLAHLQTALKSSTWSFIISLSKVFTIMAEGES